MVKQIAVLLTAVFLIAPQALSQQKRAPAKPAKTGSPAPAATRPFAASTAPAEEEPGTEEPQTVLPIKVKGQAPEEFNVDLEIVKPPFKYQEGVGRDPFQTPLTQLQAKTAGPGGRAPAGQAKAPVEPTKVVDVDTQRKLLEELQVLQTKIENFLAMKPVDEKMILRLDDEMSRKLATAEKSVADKALRAELGKLQRARAVFGTRLAEIKQRNFTAAVEGQAASVDQLYEAHQYKEAAKEAKDLIAFVDKNKELMAADPALASKMANIVSHVTAMARRAEIHEEFDKKVFVVTGINWSPKGGSAIINGKADVTVDSVVEGVKIVKITENGLVVEYRGELFEKPFVD